MRRFVTALFALILVLAACGDDDASETTTAAAAETTMAMDMEEGEEHSEDEAHEEGDEHSEEEHADEEMTHEEEAHEEGDEHAEEEHSADDDHAARVAQAEELGIELTLEYFPEAEGEVTSEYTIVMTDFAFDCGCVRLHAG